ncbi:hypothetical protein Aperf_G00000121326 [Anoplocephala perfoliata]
MSVDGLGIQRELGELESLEVYFGDTSREVELMERGMRQHQDSLLSLDSKSDIDQKLIVPFLTSPPGLIRRFADCDLTGDCHIHEIPNLGSELPSGSSLPGDNMLVQPSTSSPKSQSSCNDGIRGSKKE